MEGEILPPERGGVSSRRRYGSKYDGSLSTKDIAGRIRADLKAAVAAGDLPGDSVTYGVRARYFSGGSAIDITIRGFGATRVDGNGAETDNRRDGKSWPWLTDAARDVMAKVSAIRDAYNHDGSDIMTDYFDVNYYGSVEFESDWEAGERARLNAKRLADKNKPKAPKVNKRALVDHVSKHHRRSWNWANTTNFATLSAAHAAMHRHGRYAFDTDHTHEEGEWLRAS